MRRLPPACAPPGLHLIELRRPGRGRWRAAAICQKTAVQGGAARGNAAMRQNAAFASRAALRSFSARAIRRSGGRRPSGGSDRRPEARRPAEPGRPERGWFASGVRDGAFGHPRPAPGRSAARAGGRRTAPATHADKLRTLRISGQYVAKMQLLAAPVAAAAGSRRRGPLPARGGAVARGPARRCGGRMRATARGEAASPRRRVTAPRPQCRAERRQGHSGKEIRGRAAVSNGSGEGWDSRPAPDARKRPAEPCDEGPRRRRGPPCRALRGDAGRGRFFWLTLRRFC